MKARSLLFLSLVLLGHAHGAVLRVPGDYATIQGALDQTASGDEVRVAPGTWSGPENRDLHFPVSKVSLVSEAGPALTVIDAEGLGRGILVDGDVSTGVVIRGFSVMGGRADWGAGIALFNEATLDVEDCWMIGNVATGDGGGLAAVGSYATLRVSRCLLRGNVSGGFGGGLSVNGTYDFQATNCVVVGNRAVSGGGVSFYGAFFPTLTNVLITRNASTERDGGGLFFHECFDPIIDHCTIVDNRAATTGGAIRNRVTSTEMTNSILWGNAPDVVSGSGGLAAQHCDIQGGWPGHGNLDADPRFTDYDGIRYLLSPNSPAIDAGIGEADGIDWGSLHPGYGRANGPDSDMGAFGGPQAAAWLDFPRP